jgi:peptidoglycan/LPS O-acetylase OafA/YrhL
MSVVARTGWVAAAIVAAYFLAVLTYGSADWLARAPHIWDDGFAGPIRTILVILMLSVMIFFAVQTDDKAVRAMWVFAALALVTYAGLKATGLADPDVPQDWLARHLLEPLRHMAGLG